MALQCDVTSSEGLTVTAAYIRPRFEVRKKVGEGDVKVVYLFVECEVYQSEAIANTAGGKRLQIGGVDRFKGAWDPAGGGLEVQGYALMKAQPDLLGAIDV